MTSIATAARAYAAALDRLQAARDFLSVTASGWSPPSIAKVSVSWAEGSALHGYDDLTRAISDIVTADMTRLLKAALGKFEADVRVADRNLRFAQEAGNDGRMKAGESPAAAESLTVDGEA